LRTPNAATPTAATQPRSAPTPGAETRQVLLTLGALCLVVALTAGTALVYSALGRGGQEILMVAITLLLLVGAAKVRRLPATAEALGAVGLAGCVVDAIAARSLHLSVAVGPPLHWYIAIAALGIAAVAAALGTIAPRLAIAPVGWAGAVLTASVAAINPISSIPTALLAPVGLAVGIGLDAALRRLGRPAAPARVVTGFGAAGVVVVGFGGSLFAAAHHELAGWCGIAVPVALLLLPARFDISEWLADGLTARISGGAAGLLMIAAAVDTGVDARTAAAVVFPVLAITGLVPSGSALIGRLRLSAGVLGALTGAAAWISLVAVNGRFAAVDFALALVAAAVALAWPSSQSAGTTIRIAALGAATVLASIAAGIGLNLHGVTTPEAYIATPAGLWLVWGAGWLLLDRQQPSVLLAPGLVVGLLPTMAFALADDHNRQIVVLVVATLLVGIGAELRLTTPIAAGSVVIGLLCLRLVGPELAMVPRWVSMGAVGLVLLTLGATWEARLDDVRRLTGALRPRLSALR
jgi:hypothetical protein